MKQLVCSCIVFLLSVLSNEEAVGDTTSTCSSSNGIRLVSLSCQSHSRCPSDVCGRRDSAVSTYSTFEHRCFCDPLCNIYGDCCFGLQPCPPHLPSDVKQAAANLRCVNPSKLLISVNIGLFINHPEISRIHWTEYGIYMRNTCSESWPRDENSQLVREKCEKADMSVYISNALSVTPVSTPDITYSNVYCAICNNHNVSEYIYWKPGLYCDDGTRSDPLNGNVTLQNTEQSCSIAYFEQPSVTPRWLDPLRPCIAEMVFDECLPYNLLCNTSVHLPMDGFNCSNDYNCTAARCRSYTDIAYQVRDFRFFKNVDCAQCNGVGLDSIRCDRINSNNGHNCVVCTSFVALLDFGARGQISFHAGGITTVVTDSCANGQVYNPGRMHCQDLVCPPTFELAGDNCKPSRARKVLLSFTLILFTNTTMQKLQEITREENADSFQNDFLVALHPLLVNGTIRQLNISVCNTTLDIELVIEVDNDNHTIDRTRSSLTNTPLQFYYSGIIFQSSAQDSSVVTVQDSSGFIDLACNAYIALNESEYQLLDNSTMLLTANNQLLQQSQYIISNYGTAFRCNEFNRIFNRTVTVVKAWSYNTAVVVVSVIGSGVLMFACLSLFITYSLFKELRTLPGQCIMGYALSITIGQIFFIFGPGLTGNENVCTAMDTSTYSVPMPLQYITRCEPVIATRIELAHR